MASSNSLDFCSDLFVMLLSGCGLWPFNPHWVDEHRDVFSISASLHKPELKSNAEPAPVAASSWMPAGLISEKLFEFLEERAALDETRPKAAATQLATLALADTVVRAPRNRPGRVLESKCMADSLDLASAVPTVCQRVQAPGRHLSVNLSECVATDERRRLRQPRVNVLDEKPSQPKVLNSLERLGRLSDVTQQREQARKDKEEKKRQKNERKAEKAVVAAAKASAKQRLLDREQPIVLLLCMYGYLEAGMSKPTMKAMQLFMKKNMIKTRSSNANR
jgi:hypothetical protein